MSAYTKGPWKHTTEGCDSHIHSADGESLMCDTQYYPWCPKNKADWHLIAAAPELLEALKAIEAHHIEINTRAGRPLSASCTLAIARNAIAKAEGK